MAKAYRSKLDHLANHDCERCELHETTDRVCVMGRGNPKSRIMILGEAPGEREAETGKVFSGRAGQLLDLHLRESGLAESEPYISNVVKCRPPDNRSPDRDEWEACAYYLGQEVEACDPSHLLLLGNTALQVVCGKRGITKYRGIRLDAKHLDLRRTEVMATIHPAYVLRNPGQGAVFAEDIKRFKRLVDGKFSAVPVKKVLVRTTEGLKQLKRMLMEADEISYDVENHGKPWEKDWYITCLGVSMDGETGYVVPLYHPQSPWKRNWIKILRYLKPAFERKDCKYDAQNGKHDNVELAGAGVFVDHTFDIMLASHLLDENRPKNLGFLSQTLLGADVYKGTVSLKEDGGYAEDIRDLAIYNGNDVGYTYQIKQKLKAELRDQPRLARIFAKLMMPGSRVIQQVEWAGMWCDAERLLTRIEETGDKVDELVEVMHEHNPRATELGRAGDFNYNSTQQLGRWLFGATRTGGLGLEPLEVTKGGAPSTREAVLLHYRDHPAVRALLRYRTLQLKWLNTCLVPWGGRLDSRSRIHTVYKLYGTVTGRLSGDMQQVPRDPFIRSVFGAPPGWQFVSADYSQIELRIAALISNEGRMRRAFDTGEDLHLLTAVSLTGKLPGDVTKEERKKAKAVNFGFLYGMYPKKFRAYAFENFDLEVSIHEAEDARRRYFELFPDLPAWHRRQERIVRAVHQVQSPIGRVRHLPDVLSSDHGVAQEAVRQAINSPVQSCASDMMLFAMIHLHDRLNPNECFMVGTLHDQIMFQCKEDKLDKWAPVIKDTMENLPLRRTFGAKIDVPIVADVEWGQHWAEPVGQL